MLAAAFALVVPIAFVRPLALVALLAAPLAFRPIAAVRRGAAGPALIPVLAATGQVQLVFGILLAVGVAASA